ncbi:hypothetical protein ILYODFUR_037815 [Ilyodon furcidens]|uniref:Uncharacterized protein n=1 Tax=Ilyodon furcidens TaxID=33524 RepID=A0ABV0V9F2_9TELE
MKPLIGNGKKLQLLPAHILQNSSTVEVQTPLQPNLNLFNRMCKNNPPEKISSQLSRNNSNPVAFLSSEDPVTLLLLSGFLSCLNRCIIQINLLKCCPGLVVVLTSELKEMLHYDRRYVLMSLSLLKDLSADVTIRGMVGILHPCLCFSFNSFK